MNDVMALQDVEFQDPVTVAGQQRPDLEQCVGEEPAVDQARVAQLVAGAQERGLDLARRMSYWVG